MQIKLANIAIDMHVTWDVWIEIEFGIETYSELLLLFGVQLQGASHLCDSISLNHTQDSFVNMVNMHR